MELRQYLAILRRWAWLLVVGTLLAGATSYLVSSSMPKVYRASVKLLINQAQSATGVTYNDILTSERLTKTYGEMIRDRPLLDEVNSKLGTGYTAETLARQINVEAIKDTQLLRVSVENNNPALAKDIANTLAELFIERNKTMQTSQSADSRRSVNDQLTAVQEDMRKTSAALDVLRGGTDSRPEPEKSAETARLQSLLAQYQTSYASLIRTNQEMRIAEAQSFDTIRVTEPAIQPSGPVKPQVMMNTILAAVVGLMLAAGVALLIEYLDDTVKTVETVEKETGLSTVGFIARIPHKQDQSVLIAARQPRSPLTEAYRTLRTNIQFAGVDKRVNQLLITSSNPREGKTTTLANLATCMAQAGQRVLVVDADLRRPTLHRLFDLSNKQGLTNLLLQENARPEEVIQATAIPNLWLMASGPLPPNPSELLSSKRMGAILEKLNEHAEMILIDSPPVLAVTDPSLLATRVGGTLLVVDWGRTRSGEMKRAVQNLRSVGVTPLGVIANKLKSRSGGYYYYYYHRYYYASDDTPSSNGHHSNKDPELANRR